MISFILISSFHGSINTLFWEINDALYERDFKKIMLI